MPIAPTPTRNVSTAFAAVVVVAGQAFGAPGVATAPVVEMLPGIVKPNASVELAPSVDGVLQVLHAREGDRVAAGETLAVVDRELAEASLRQARFDAERTAAIKLATTRIDVTRKYLARIEQAFAKQAASELELDEARGRVNEAEAALTEANEEIAAASRRLEAAEAQHAAHELRTPIAGEVVRISARRGEMVQRSEPIAMVVDLAELRADLYVPTRLLGALHVGEVYTLSAEPPVARDLQATLIHREPLIDAATDTFRCRFLIDNHDLRLPAGFVVRLREPVGSAPGAEPLTRDR